MKRKHFDIILILLVSLVMGTIVRFLCTGPNGKEITLIKYPTPTLTNDDLNTLNLEILDKGPAEIDINQCYTIFENNKALFIDARDSITYQEDHIQGAINIDWAADVEYQYYPLDNIDTDSMLVIYCSGDGCELSKELGEYLFYELEYKNILLYEGGFQEWKKKNFPVNSND